MTEPTTRDDQQDDFQLLARFYNSASKIHESTFEADRNEMLSFVIRFFDVFFTSYTELLSEEILFTDKSKGRIFSSTFFQFELEKLYLLQQRLAKYPYDLKEFPRAEFVKMVVSPGSESGPKREAAGLTRELLEHLSSISDKLMKILKGHNDEARQFIAGEPRAISEELLHQGSFAIPWYSEKVASEQGEEENTVRETLTQVVSIILLFTRYIRDERADQFVLALENLNRTIASGQDELRRLMTVAGYHKFLKQHDL